MFDSNLAWDWANRLLTLFQGLNSLLVGLGVAAFITALLYSLMANRGR